MATKNHFSNYENLFSAYGESVSSQTTTSKANIEQEIKNKTIHLNNLNASINQINMFLANPGKKPIIDTRKSTELLPKILKQLEQAKNELEELKSSININPELTRQYALGNLRFEENRLLKTKSEILKLEDTINNPNIEAKEKTVAKAKHTKAQKLLSTVNENIAKFENIIKISDEQIAKITEAEEKLANIQAKYDAILLDEKKYARETRDENALFDEEIKAKKLTRTQLLVKKKNTIKEIEELKEQSKNISITNTGSIEEFKKFLTDNGFSTVHAEELFELYKKPNYKLNAISKNEFKLRKQHPKRDKFLKKFVIPTTLTAGGVGLGCGAIASTIATGGSSWWFIQFTSSASVNFLQAALPGAAFGALAAVTTIKLKDAFTKLHYNRKYGNANKILKDAESTQLDELLEKIENTKDDILDLRTGRKNVFSRFGRAIKRTAKNIVNRNRIHHIESVTEQLVEKFNNILNNKEISMEVKLEKLTPIYEVLTKINNFYAKDIKKSKIFAMLNCKETDKNHSHKETIENLDIYAKLNMYLEKINNLENVSSTAKKKAHKQAKADLVKQNVVAEKLLNGEQVTGLVAKRYLELVKASDKNQTPTSRIIDSYVIANGELNITFKDGKSSSYQIENADQIKNVESVNKGKILLITYKNGEQASIPSTMPKTKINLNIAGEFKILDKLKETAVIDYLAEQKGIDKDTIFTFIDALKATKFNKNGKEKAKPSAFMKSKAYKENPEYAKIIKEVADIIKNPNVVYIDYGFNT